MNDELGENLQRGQTTNKTTVLIAGLILVVAGAIAWKLLSSNTTPTNKITAEVQPEVPTAPVQQKATLAGKIVYSGLVPDAGDSGEVRIFIRESGAQTEFTDTGLSVPLMENQVWSYTEAIAGKNYEVRAALKDNGLTLVLSDVETVTAPALNIDLDLNVSWQALGMTPEQVNANISGQVTVNGYIPSGSQIQVLDKENNQQSTLLTLTAAEEASFTLREITVTENYILTAILADKNGNVIGKSSQEVTADAGDTKVDFVINSTAKAPATPTPTPTPVATPTPTTTTAAPAATPQPTGAKMSGQVIINGPLDANSRILILGKRPSESDYKVWQTINDPNNSGQYWEYNQAIAGEDYNVQVALQVNENNTGTANMITTVAPASSLNFTLNTGVSLPAPSSQPTVDPCTRDGDRWKTIIKIPGISDAGQYLIQIGSKEGYSDLYNQVVAAPANGAELKFTQGGFETGKPNYIRYTYSSCRNCKSQANFTGWSVTKSFTCE